MRPLSFSGQRIVDRHPPDHRARYLRSTPPWLCPVRVASASAPSESRRPARRPPEESPLLCAPPAPPCAFAQNHLGRDGWSPPPRALPDVQQPRPSPCRSEGSRCCCPTQRHCRRRAARATSVRLPLREAIPVHPCAKTLSRRCRESR